MCPNETYSRVHIEKHLSDRFPVMNSLKQRDALLLLLFNFALGKPGGLEIECSTSAVSLC